MDIVHEHRWRFLGRAGLHPGGRWVAGDGDVIDMATCDRPNVMECLTCGARSLVRCGSARASLCVPCGASYRRRVRVVATSGRSTCMLTLTAPGSSSHNRPNGKRCPCTPVGGVDLGRWNGEAVGRWNRLHQDLERRYGVKIVYFKGVEAQQRGALHFHVLFRLPPGVELQRGKVRALAMKHGFGHSLDLAPTPDDRAAGYCAKYVSKSADERAEVPYVHPSTGEVGPGRWRPWSASRAWGMTMGQVLAGQALWARRLAAGGEGVGSEPAQPAEGPFKPKESRYTRMDERTGIG